jgi:fructose-1,6-bisphosphatase
MSVNSVTLRQWLASQPGALVATVMAVAEAAARISAVAASSQCASLLAGSDGARPERTEPVLAACADRCIDEALGGCEHVAGWASGEGSAPFVSNWHAESGQFLVVYDPFNGAAQAEANVPGGTLFSILPHPFHGTTPGAAGFLQPGRRQVAAGYVIYGAATVLALSVGRGVAMFTLDPRDAVWRLTREGVEVPRSTSEFAINTAEQRYWEKPVQRYVAECVAGADGPRGRDFSLRWTGSPVADAHRILTGGGVFLLPRDTRPQHRTGHLRLMFAAAPLAFLMEQAHAAAVTGTQQLLEVVPDTLHEKVPVILGSDDEVQLIVRYHADPSENVAWQLFRTRSLFVQPQA